jgi:hypothetical protein
MEQAKAAHRTALEQAEAAHRSAMEQAEAAHRSALEVAERQRAADLEAAEQAHQRALELSGVQQAVEHQTWQRGVRYERYARLQTLIGRARLALFTLDAEDDGTNAWYEADAERRSLFYEFHEVHHDFLMMVTGDVTSVVKTLCSLLIHACRGAPRLVHPGRTRAEFWEEEISPLRRQLDEAIIAEMGREEFDVANSRRDH